MMEDRIWLEKGDTRISVLIPGRVHRYTRFAWDIIVDQLFWQGHAFASTEMAPGEQGKTTDGMGLMHEFAANIPLVYAPMGGLFPKLGVGSLRVDKEGPYEFYHLYPIGEPCSISLTHGADYVETTCVQPECQGYAMTLRRRLTVQEDGLVIRSRLDNTGTADLDTHEYNHNFLRIDGREVGPGYVCILPRGNLEGELPDCLRLNGNELSFAEKPRVFCIQFGPQGSPRVHWQLTSGDLGIRETGEGEVLRTAIWAKPTVFSAESFVPVRARAGQSVSWQRGWQFFRPQTGDPLTGRLPCVYDEI